MATSGYSTMGGSSSGGHLAGDTDDASLEGQSRQPDEEFEVNEAGEIVAVAQEEKKETNARMIGEELMGGGPMVLPSPARLAGPKSGQSYSSTNINAATAVATTTTAQAQPSDVQTPDTVLPTPPKPLRASTLTKRQISDYGLEQVCRCRMRSKSSKRPSNSSQQLANIII